MIGFLLALAVVAYAPAEIATIERVPVGEVGGMTRPAGDGCNFCTYEFRRVSETEIRWLGTGLCTLATCSIQGPVEKFKESSKKPGAP